MLPTEHQHIKLSELVARVEQALKERFASEYFWVVAEISGHKFYGGQDRHYFEFVEKSEGQSDPIAKMRGVAWTSGSISIRAFEEATLQKFTNGIQVLAKVKVEYHMAHGLSLVLVDVDQFFTLGNLERQRMETLHRLVTDNKDAVQKVGEEYVTRNKTLPLKIVLQKLAVVASPNSEGYVDFTHTIQSTRFGYKFDLDIYQSSVQGPLAEEELVQTLVRVFESGIKYDAVVIIRGGGAKTDFLVFDSYRLARAVARFPIPVITGIGHHKDVSIVDLMCHTSTKTPTKAAEFIISHNRSFEESLFKLQNTVVIRSQQLLAHQHKNINNANTRVINLTRVLLADHAETLTRHRQRITTGGDRLLHKHESRLRSLLHHLSAQPLILTAKRQSDLRHLGARVDTLSQGFVKNKQRQLEHFLSVVRVMHPDNVLKKGFAILSSKGKILSAVDDVVEGQELDLLTHDYKIKTTVKQKTKLTNGQHEL